MQNTTIKLNSDFVCDWLIVLVLTTDAFRAGFNFVLVRFGAGVLSPLFTGVLMFLPLFLLLITNRGGKMMKRLLTFLLLLIAAVFYFYITLLIHPNYEKYIIREDYLGAWQAVFRPDTGALYYCLAFCLVKDSKRVLKDLKIAAYILMLFCIYQALVSNGEWEAYDHRGKVITQSYALNYGYNLMFSGIILINSYLSDRKNKLDLAAAVGALALTLSQGSRGAFLCLAVYAVLYVLIRLNKMKLSWRILICVGIFAAYLFISANILPIMKQLMKLLSGYTGNSRLITMFLSGNIASDNGRTEIYEIAWNAIREQGLLGNGAYGSRWIISPRYFWGYPHNIYLEFLLEFGVILGTLLAAFLVFRILKAMSVKNEDTLMVMTILLSMNVKLLISDSFWMYGHFWAMLGLLYAIRHTKALRQGPEQNDMLQVNK